MKKTLSAILALVLIVSLMPTALATIDYDDVPYPVEGGNIYFDKATGTITGADINITAANIPEKIQGVTVKEIGFPAFVYCHSLASVTIPDTVTVIGNEAFEECSSLTSIAIPDSVTKIGEGAFTLCTSLESITIPDGVTEIGFHTFWGCSSLTNIIIPDSVTSIGGNAFTKCTSLTNFTIPNSVTEIGDSAFISCDSLTSINIPASVTKIGELAFRFNSSLTDIYFGGTEAQWNKAIPNEFCYDADSVNVHFNCEYMYNTVDHGAGVDKLVEGAVDNVTTQEEAVQAVQELTKKMTPEHKSSATGRDLAILMAETAAAKASAQSVTGNEVTINAANVALLLEKSESAVTAVEEALADGGITANRSLANTVIFAAAETGEFTVKVEPEILTTGVDKVRFETPAYAITLKIADLKDDLANGEIIILASGTNTVSLEMPDGQLSRPVTISFPGNYDSDDANAVTKEDGNSVTSKYNPATSTMDGKVTETGRYTVKRNSKDFKDIGDKIGEMQEAIRYLASKGIINGTSPTTFSPDKPITRAEIAALMVRALGLTDNSAVPGFKDVTKNDWFYATAASSQRAGLIKGYEDNTFRGNNTISKNEIIAVAARSLTTEMGYKNPASSSQYLGKYKDTVADWVQSDVALATQENLIVYRMDGDFSGTEALTRGDAAIILYRLFQRIW